MLRFIDSADHYATADLTAKYNAAPNVVVDAGNGRFAGNSLKVGILPGSYVIKTLDNQATWIVGFAFNPAGFPDTNAVIFKLLDQGSTQVDLRVYADGTLALTRNGAALTNGASTFALQVGSWHFIEIKVTISASISANTCKVYVNNTQVINVATGQQTQATANLTANSIVLAGCVANCHFDDLYICDGTGSTNNGILGDSRIFMVLPTGAGDSTQLSVFGSGNNWSAVDDNPPDGDTTYVYSSTPGNYDLYNLADPTITGAILGLQTVVYARKDDAGARTMAATIKTNGVVYDGATLAPGTTYKFETEIRETNPNTAIAWTSGDINALQSGVKVVA